MKTKSTQHDHSCTHLKRKTLQLSAQQKTLTGRSNGAAKGTCSTCSLGEPYLHPTHAHAQGGRSALFTLLHLPSSLLLRRIISVLSGPHLQIKYTGKLEVMHHVLQQKELWETRQGELTCQRRHSPGSPQTGTWGSIR